MSRFIFLQSLGYHLTYGEGLMG